MHNTGYNQQYAAQQQQQGAYGYDQAQQQQHHGYDQQQHHHQQSQQQQLQPQQQQYQDPHGPASGVYDSPTDPQARWSWNMYPTNRLDGARMVVPLACMYTPLGAECVQLPYSPVRCATCTGIMNPFCRFDTRTRSWTCPLCLASNSLPPQYAQASEYNSPAELTVGNETVEYVTVDPQRQPPTFAFVVDTCLDTDEELEGLKEFLLDAVDKIPATSAVTFITYGATVQVWELCGATAYPRCYALRGAQEITPEGLERLIPHTQRIVGPLAAVGATVTALIAGLQRDQWPVAKGCRAFRCTGAALSAAASILQKVSPGTGCAILAFVSGACTVGPGLIVDVSREKMIRGHTDIRDATATAGYWASSCDFYDSLMRRIVAQGHALNCFTACLDQLGVAEMKLCIQSSGGVSLNAESWLQAPFRISLHQFFDRRAADGVLKMGLNATMDVVASPSWKVLGVIGPCVGTGKKSSSIGDTEIGLGGTCQWTTCMIDATTTFAIYYDAASSAAGTASAAQSHRHTQIITRYEQGSETRVRVTTLAHRQHNNPPIQDIVAAFDQETAAVVLARQAVHKTDTQPVFDVLRWLDRAVVRLVARFGDYTKDQPSSLRLPDQFVYFPAFMFHLRRSGYLQVFNSSPDESAIMRLQLLKSSVPDSIVQIQPTLYSYQLAKAPRPVPLDSSAIQPENILLLDTFFEVLVHYGATVAAWKRAGYAEQPEYAHFKEFMDMPLADADVIIGGRYPTPRLIDVCQDDPDARILYNRINPSRSYAQTQGGQEAYGSQEGELVYTDDASLQTFMEHLKKVAVSQ